MPVVISRKPEVKLGLYKRKYNYTVFSILSFKLCVTCVWQYMCLNDSKPKVGWDINHTAATQFKWVYMPQVPVSRWTCWLLAEYKYKGMVDCFSFQCILCVKFIKQALIGKMCWCYCTFHPWNFFMDLNDMIGYLFFC